MNLIDEVTQSVFRNPSMPAFIFNGGVITYQEFYSLWCAVTKTIHEQGARPGDIVGLSMEQTPLHCVAMLALARLGVVSVPVHLELPQPLRERIVAKYDISIMLSLNDIHGIARVKSIRLDKIQSSADEIGMDFADYAPDAATPFRISLTSGTTGDLKGDMLTHGQLLDRIEKTLYGCDCDCSSRVMPSDINSAMGLSLAIGILKIGGTLVFPNSYLSKDRMAAINLHAVTHAFFSQWAASQMVALQPNHGVTFPTLRHLRLVGSTPSESLLNTLCTKFTPHVFVSYGLTEIGPVSIATPEILAAWPRSSGKVLPWIKVDVLDEAGQVLPPDTSGEIRLTVTGGPTKYYRDPQETAKKFRDGWFYTGDLGRLTEDGQLFIEGRIDEIINLDGYKVNPIYVEEVLARHPQVLEAVAFSKRDDTGAIFLAAALVLRNEEANIDDVINYAGQQLGWGQPKRFFIMPGFPRTPNGKVIRAEVVAAAIKTK